MDTGYNPKTFAKYYDYIFLVEDQPYNINSFRQIGMSEPFPDDEFGKSTFIVPEDKTDLVYEDCRIVQG